jgi:hypothetical protein
MKPFQQLLLAPVALGLLSPLAASAADLNLDGINKYAGPSAAKSQSQVTSISQFSDVQPTEWAYQALSNLVEQYGCVAGYPDGTFRGKKPLSRWEAAALLNACLDRITEVTDELRRLMKEFEAELAVLKGRVDGLEAKVGELEATQFSTTTKLQGEATFVLGALTAGGDRRGAINSVPPLKLPGARQPAVRLRKTSDLYNQALGATTFSYDVRLNLITSFTGKDQLFTRLRSGNFNNAFNGIDASTNLTTLDRASNGFGAAPSSDVVGIDRLWYRFPVGKEFAFIVGARARNTESLAVTPSVYNSAILDYFSVWGAPGVYNKATGSLLAGIWRQNVKKGQAGFSFAANYVAQQGNVGTVFDTNPNACAGTEGGIGTDCSRGSFLAQLNYTAPQWNISLAYRYGQAATNFRRTTGFAGSNSSFLANGSSNNFAINGYWQPKTAGFIPSLSVGWGINTLANNSISGSAAETPWNRPFVKESQSWFAGLQWRDVFAKGNAAGFAVGQGTFATRLSSTSLSNSEARRLRVSFNTTPDDGNYVWEWWYRFRVTDNISITPAIFYLSRPLGQNTGSNDDFNIFGGLVQTVFRF